MIQLVSNEIAESTQNRLTTLQGEVNTEATFELKKQKAKSLWTNKNSGVVGKAAFDNIKETLITMCVSVEVCNYCEQNEANDIEHIAPKSFFPQSAFVWSNYLLACKQCNTGYKLDKCHVLDNEGNIYGVRRGNEPSHQILAMINPRIENPNDFLILNMRTYEFELIPELSKTAENKAEKTLEILQLNNRDALKTARRHAANYYYNRMERLVKILACDTIQEIEHNLTPHDARINTTQSVPAIKLSIKENFKKDIQTHQHPSVWYVIKNIERRIYPKWKILFEQLPEALDW